MILQALVRCYEALAGRGELEKEGWSPVKVSWGLELDADGQVKSLHRKRVKLIQPLLRCIRNGGIRMFCHDKSNVLKHLKPSIICLPPVSSLPLHPHIYLKFLFENYLTFSDWIIIYLHKTFLSLQFLRQMIWQIQTWLFT